MCKNVFKALGFCFVVCLISMSSSPVTAAPDTLGEIKIVDSAGADPDVAVDSEGALHIVFVQGGLTHYRKVDPPYTDDNNIGKRFTVGKGGNPQVAVDSLNNPHVVFGRARYAYWNENGFTEAEQAFSAWRKNLIDIDSQDRVYIVADVFSPRSTQVSVYKNGKRLKIAGKYKTKWVGEDNPGGISIDHETDLMHITLREGAYTYYRNFEFETGNTEDRYKFPNKSGDFAWCTVAPETGIIHSVYTAAHARGIYFASKENGKWDNRFRVANGLLARENDDVNPVSATDANGYTYVTFRGRGLENRTEAPGHGFFFVVYPEGEAYPDGDTLPDVQKFMVYSRDQSQGKAGGKLTNPNVASHPKMTGAYVVWGERKVRVRSLGDVSFANGVGGSVSGVISNILLNQGDVK